MLGHAFPVFLKFQGGKAVASFVGAFLCLTPLPLLAVLAFSSLPWRRTRYISLGSILAAGCFPLAVWLISHPPGACRSPRLLLRRLHRLAARFEHRAAARRHRARLPLRRRSK